MHLATEQIGDEPKTEPSSQLEFKSVPPDQLIYIWPKIKPMVERGLAHGQGDTTTADELLKNIADGKFYLWVAHKGDDVLVGMIVSVRINPTGRKIHIEMLAGRDAFRWDDHLEQLLKDFKELTGAYCIEASCRLGVARILERRGWKKKSVIMEL